MNFLFCQTSSATLDSAQQVKRPGCETCHLPPFSAVVKNEWSYSLPPYISLNDAQEIPLPSILQFWIQMTLASHHILMSGQFCWFACSRQAVRKGFTRFLIQNSLSSQNPHNIQYSTQCIVHYIAALQKAYRVCPTRKRTRLAGGTLLRVATIRHTTGTHYRHIPFHFSHNERNPVQISLQYLH